MNTRLTALLLLMFLCAAGAMAQVGTTGLSFLKTGVGARALAMGEASTAMAGDPSALYYNPAALSGIGEPQLFLTHRAWIQGTNTEYLAATGTVAGLRLGISANATSVGDIEIRNIPGPPLGTFDARNAAFGLTAAVPLDPSLSIGATVKYLYEKILIYDASGFAADLGARYELSKAGVIGVSVSNLGSMGALEQESSVLPTTLRAGGSLVDELTEMDAALTFAADVVSSTKEGKTRFQTGAEFLYHQSFAFRAGFTTGIDARNVSAGIGVYQGLFRFDYAFVPFTDQLGSAHTFSVGLRFGE